MSYRVIIQNMSEGDPVIVRFGIKPPDQSTSAQGVRIVRPVLPVTIGERESGRSKYPKRIGKPEDFGSIVESHLPETWINKLVNGQTPGTGSHEVNNQVTAIKESVVYSRLQTEKARAQAFAAAREQHPDRSRPYSPAVPKHQKDLWKKSLLNPNR